MKFILKAVLLLAVVSTASAENGLQLVNAWVREAPPVVENSAVFFTLENNSDQDRVLVSASTEVAAMNQVHEHRMEDGLMKMREVEGGVKVPAHSQVQFKPGGYHIMLMKLYKPLETGSKVTLTLTFDDGAQLTDEVLVRPDQKKQ